MSLQDPVSSALTHIRNAQMRGLREALVPKSKLIAEVMRVMQQEGFIESFKEDEGGRSLKVELRYLQEGTQLKAVIERIERVSKPSRRRFVGMDELSKLTVPGFGIYILTTPRGVMSHHQAKMERVGGEVICCVA